MKKITITKETIKNNGKKILKGVAIGAAGVAIGAIGMKMKKDRTVHEIIEEGINNIEEIEDAFKAGAEMVGCRAGICNIGGYTANTGNIERFKEVDEFDKYIDELYEEYITVD